MRRRNAFLILVVAVALAVFFFAPVVGGEVPDCFSHTSTHSPVSISYYLFGMGGVVYNYYQIFSQRSVCHF